MYKGLFKYVFLGLGGSGLVCITMYLSNAANQLLSSLPMPDLANRPDIIEEEIVPEEPKKEEEEATETQSEKSEDSEESSTEQSASTESGSQNADSQTEQTQSQPSTSNSSGTSDIAEVIKHHSLELFDNSFKWQRTGGSGDLTSIHQLVRSSRILLDALNQFSAQNTAK